MTIDQILEKYKGKIGNRQKLTGKKPEPRSNPFKTGIDIELSKKSYPFSIKHNTKHLYAGLSVFYEKYRMDMFSGEDLPVISYKQYRDFIKLYFKLILIRVLYEGFIFILPYYLGRFYFKKSNRRGYIKSEPNKILTNAHSFRKFFNIKWDKQLSHFKNRTVWKFIPSNSTKKEYAQRVFSSIDKEDPTPPIIAYDHNERKWT